MTGVQTCALPISLERKTMLARKGPPPYLPRPRNHWDYLLDEVQWMAVDFKQERRLKMSHCYAISQMCAESAISRFGYSESQDCKKSMNTTTTGAADFYMQAVGAECGDSNLPLNAICGVELEKKGEDSGVATDANQATFKFTNRAKKSLALSISCLVKKHWQNVSESLSTHRTEAIELLKMCRVIEQEVEEEQLPVIPLKIDPIVEVKVEIDCSDFQKENEHISRCLTLTNYLDPMGSLLNEHSSAEYCDLKKRRDHDECDPGSVSSQIPNSSSSNPCGEFSLHSHQQDALDALIERNKQGYGAILYEIGRAHV